MFLFIVFALIAIVAALGVILSRKPVYSALFLLLNFATLAALYIMLQAQFLAAVQVIVYAGAIVVLILFVVMLIGGGELSSGDRRTRDPGHSDCRPRVAGSPGRPWLAAHHGDCVGRAALGGRGLWSHHRASEPGPGQRGGLRAGSVEAIGSVLYTDYLLPFELASVLLLVGMIGAVVLARKRR